MREVTYLDGMVYIFIFFANPLRRKFIKSSFDKQTEGIRNEGKAPARVAR